MADDLDMEMDIETPRAKPPLGGSSAAAILLMLLEEEEAATKHQHKPKTKY